MERIQSKFTILEPGCCSMIQMKDILLSGITLQTEQNIFGEWPGQDNPLKDIVKQGIPN